jgi:hypothetical protein
MTAVILHVIHPSIYTVDIKHSLSPIMMCFMSHLYDARPWTIHAASHFLVVYKIKKKKIVQIYMKCELSMDPPYTLLQYFYKIWICHPQKCTLHYDMLWAITRQITHTVYHVGPRDDHIMNVKNGHQRKSIEPYSPCMHCP